jgi:hypothetical protein
MNAKIKNTVVKKVNEYLKDKYIHVDGPHPMEEYGANYVSKDVLRNALNMTFTETYREMEKRRRKLNQR